MFSIIFKMVDTDTCVLPTRLVSCRQYRLPMPTSKPWGVFVTYRGKIIVAGLIIIRPSCLWCCLFQILEVLPTRLVTVTVVKERVKLIYVPEAPVFKFLVAVFATLVVLLFVLVLVQWNKKRFRTTMHVLNQRKRRQRRCKNITYDVSTTEGSDAHLIWVAGM